MTLPLDVRMKLSTPLRVGISAGLRFSEFHTLPLPAKIWQSHARIIVQSLEETRRVALLGSSLQGQYNTVKAWVDELLTVRTRLVSEILVLRPFEYFHCNNAKRLIKSIDNFYITLASSIDNDELLTNLDFSWGDSLVAWLVPENFVQGVNISRAFNVDADAISDGNGEFSPSRVFSLHYLALDKLLNILEPHMNSLVGSISQDPLVAVSIVGWICGAADPVVAYRSMSHLLDEFSNSRSNSVIAYANAHLQEIDPALRQGRNRINRALKQAEFTAGTDVEESSLVLVEAYKRLVEGPVRQYGWVHHCLVRGSWTPPPMLSVVRESIISDGGWIAEFARQSILPGVRNGEAHEVIFWDGVRQSYAVGEHVTEVSTVRDAVIQADSFARGCESAIAWQRSLLTVSRLGPPRSEDTGRLSPWRRAEALIGANGLHLVDVNFNSSVAKIVCQNITQKNINPCFQALICCNALLPHVKRFEVRRKGEEQPVISVTSDALSNNMAVWESAVSQFSSVPLSTFLPVNLVARQESEAPFQAVRSVAWIAVDDLLDALDGSVGECDVDNLSIFEQRVALIREAIVQCAGVPPDASYRLRLNLLLTEVERLLVTIRDPSFSPTRWHAFDDLDSIVKIRLWWNSWGPVMRLPGVLRSNVWSNMGMMTNARKRDPSVRHHTI